MDNKRGIRFLVIAAVLALGVLWSLTAASQQQGQQGHEGYPDGELLCTANWLLKHPEQQGLVIVDTRRDKYFDNALIPGAIRMPWNLFRTNNRARNLADCFVGLDQAQKILGEHGITRSSRVVLYDSVERDGGATASYVFWVLDLLGHEDKMILERGIDGWKDAGGQVVSSPAELGPVLYQAPVKEMDLSRWVNGDFVRHRLGDLYYQPLDVRSNGEYTGELANKALNGEVLKRGHLPGAINIPDAANWIDEQSKDIRTYEGLQRLYRGLDPAKAVIPYCHSGRRASFAYFILRLMGFSDVRLYERSWNEWGQSGLYFPIQSAMQRPAGNDLPQAQKTMAPAASPTRPGPKEQPASGGYVSCGG